MTGPFATRLTALFTKRPVPGLVKTRLTPPLTIEQAALLADAMLRDTVARCVLGQFRTALVFAPSKDAIWFATTFPELADQRPQVGSELGERMARFVADSFARREATSLVLIGSDQPSVPLERIHEAHRALELGDQCVLGPDSSGGYYLIGLSRNVPELFSNVPMSSEGMCTATEQVAQERGLRVKRLTEHLDVDVPADLERLRNELCNRPTDEVSRSVDFPRHTLRVLAELLPTQTI